MRDNEIGGGTPFCELLAIEFGIEKFEDIISGRETIVYSDHKSLKSLNFKNPKGRWARIMRKIIESGVKVETISGKENVVADAFGFPRQEKQGTCPELNDLLRLLPVRGHDS